MGVSYSLRLCFGFELDYSVVDASFAKHVSDPGEFHMEDRFDPKTGDKVAPIKVWDRKPSKTSWYEIDGQKYDDLEPEELGRLLENKLGCYVEQFGNWSAGELTWVFYVNDPIDWKEADHLGSATIYNNSIGYTHIIALMPKVLKLQKKLEDLGYKPGEPRVFIAQRVS